MRTIRVTIEYDGDLFFGFQRQPNQQTLQSEFESVLFDIYHKKTVVQYAGRTDRGVHAKGQVVVFNDFGNIPLFKIFRMLNKALNGIAVVDIDEVSSDFDPRRYALKRQYEYWCYFGEKHVFLDRFMWHRNHIQLEMIHEHLSGFVGVHDFGYLSKLNPQVVSTIRDVSEINARMKPYQFLGYQGEAFVFTFEANSFLHHMIRKIVGLVFSLAEGQLSKNEFEDIINVRKRHRFEMAPPQGLYLSRIWYDEGAREFNNEK